MQPLTVVVRDPAPDDLTGTSEVNGVTLRSATKVRFHLNQYNRKRPEGVSAGGWPPTIKNAPGAACQADADSRLVEHQMHRHNSLPGALFFYWAGVIRSQRPQTSPLCPCLIQSKSGLTCDRTPTDPTNLYLKSCSHTHSILFCGAGCHSPPDAGHRGNPRAQRGSRG